jgi:hypothetical protein
VCGHGILEAPLKNQQVTMSQIRNVPRREPNLLPKWCKSAKRATKNEFFSELTSDTVP